MSNGSAHMGRCLTWLPKFLDRPYSTARHILFQIFYHTEDKTSVMSHTADVSHLASDEVIKSLRFLRCKARERSGVVVCFERQQGALAVDRYEILHTLIVLADTR
jgi:hypothetical protein